MEHELSIYKDEKIYYNHFAIDNPLQKNFDFHTHDICELIFLKRGNVTAIVGDKSYKFKKHCLIIFRANTPHRIQFDENTVYERYDILFDENLLGNQIFHRIPKELDFINYSENRQVIDLFTKLDYYCKNFEGKDLSVLITNITEEILFNLYLSSTDELHTGYAVTNPLVSRAVEYINKHYSEQIKIDDICRHLYITKSHLHHLFMENLKISPKKYVNIKRLSKAQKLINMGEKPTSVYSLCGFNDYGTFFRNYTTYFGYIPSQKNEIAVMRKIES